MDRFFRYKLDHVLFWVLTIFFHGYTRLWLIGEVGLTQFLLEVSIRNALLAAVIYFVFVCTEMKFLRSRIVLTCFVTGVVTFLARGDIHENLSLNIQSIFQSV